MEPRNLAAALSPQELRALTRRSDWAGWWAIGSTWAIIFGTFLALARWPHPCTFVLATIVLGGRQLALAILVHEAAHRTLFRRRFCNDHVAHWLCAWPLWSSVPSYRRHHLKHHKYTGTASDPDLSLAPLSPMTRGSLARKFARDLLGAAGVRRLIGQALMACEVFEYTVAPDLTRRPRAGRNTRDYAVAAIKNSAGFALTNGALIAVLSSLGHGWVSSSWLVAHLTTFSLFLRIRSLAEHACTERGPDPLRNTRTTRANWLARATVAPFRVNYHLEHHLWVAVPWFRLPQLHQILKQRLGLSEVSGYAAVLALVSAEDPTRREHL